MAQKALGCHHNEWLLPAAQSLSSQQVEVLGRRSCVADLHVVFRSLLQESLQSRTRVFQAPALRSHAAAA